MDEYSLPEELPGAGTWSGSPISASRKLPVSPEIVGLGSRA